MVIPIAEFNALSDREKISTLKKLYKEMGAAKIADAWGVNKAKVYKILHNLNIPTGVKKKSRKRKTQQQTVETPEVADMFNLETNKGRFELNIVTRGNSDSITNALVALFEAGRLPASTFELSLNLKEV